MADCAFKRNKDNKPLFLLCTMNYENNKNFTLSEIKEEMKLENINMKYNFIIKPVKNNEKINYSSRNDIGGHIYSIHPNILDFTKKESYSVVFGGKISYLRGLAIEPKLESLSCDYKEEYINCNIPKSYFQGQKTGYYNIYQNNHLGSKSPCYEAEPIKVVMVAENIKKLGYMFLILISFILF